MKAFDDISDPAFRAAFDGSLAVDGDGAPLLVFRGEHGRPDGGMIQTRHGSMSFGTLKTAILYATRPNHRDDAVVAPRVLPAYLRIRRPFLNEPDDPFVDLGRIERVFGREHALKVGRRFADSIENTNNWEEISLEVGVPTVRGWLRRPGARISNLYFNAYEYLDDAREVAALKAKGYDGAIHMGSGENFDEREFKAFDIAQILPATPRWLNPEEAVEFAAAHAPETVPAPAP